MFRSREATIVKRNKQKKSQFGGGGKEIIPAPVGKQVLLLHLTDMTHFTERLSRLLT
jgi:hypothetical protein